MAGVALVTTRGFGDVLELGRQNRVDLYAAHIGPSPWATLIPPARRFEIGGRMDARGTECEAFDAEEVTRVVASLRALDPPPAAIVVSLLFARRNPAHEIACAQAIEAALPGLSVHCSHASGAGTTGGEFEAARATMSAAGVDPPATSISDDSAGADPFDTELVAIGDAMQARLVDAAVSSVVREAMDCAAALFLPDGRLLGQANSLPLLLGSLEPATRGILACYPADAMQSGEAYLCNDPWHGGTHLPDFTLVAPVVVDGRVRALVATMLHQQDVGGISPGSLPTDATSIHQEGMRLPPLRLYQGGAVDPALLRMLCTNSRLPEQLAGDLAAQWAALRLGMERLAEVIDRLGTGFEARAQASLQRAEAATRSALAAAPDGEVTFEDALDGDGVDDAPVRVVVKLVKRGDALTIDLTGCAPQTRGPVNAAPGAVWAAVSYFARALAPAAASNNGCTQPLTLLTRPHSIVAPAFPAALNARTNLVKLLANALLGAWAQLHPQAAPAPNAGVAVVLSLAGVRADGSAWAFTEIIASAAGGAPWGAGGSGVSTDVGNARNTPAETIEAQAPLRVLKVAIRRGSGGAGQNRGGDGVVRAYRLLEGIASISYRGERHRTQARGAAGGHPGASGSARIERIDGSIEMLQAKARTQWRAGEVLVIETAGGGGWGTPKLAEGSAA
ncbi:MAG: hydantoinase B/oxoprolinase family protein [Burkholderiales bacterium]|nr:hydantoinase B/oxoprolinase family protein [Burkholderiales bacterium]